MSIRAARVAMGHAEKPRSRVEIRVAGPMNVATAPLGTHSTGPPSAGRT